MMKNIIDEKLHKAGENEEIKKLPDRPAVLVKLLEKSAKDLGEEVRKKRKPES